MVVSLYLKLLALLAVDHAVFRQIKVPSLFEHYRIQSSANNQITLTLSTEALLSTLRSAAAPSAANSGSVLQNTTVVMKYLSHLPTPMLPSA